MEKDNEIKQKMDEMDQNIGGGMAENEMFDKKSKIGKIKEYIYDLFESGQKFLVFAHHKDVLDAIQEAVQKKCKCKFIRIDGKTKPDQRQILVDKFQNNSEIKIAILSITAAGTGSTLTAATSVVFA